MQNVIKWGMIGCGDVTEVKSGPAFNKVPNSRLVAVMSRNAAKAEDYAKRHQVPKWYNSTQELIDDPEINAIYIATPPLSHLELTIAALKAGKSVYVEKPMAVNADAGKKMVEAAAQSNGKLTIAHYRREQPVFKKIKALIDEQVIGTVKFVTLDYLQPSLTPKELADPKIQWRLDPAIAGGGLFHDIAPHQLDLMLYFFSGQLKKH
ncbi:Gfo/Idh/MocA family protein [Pedobacter sp. NJ-S-72]